MNDGGPAFPRPVSTDETDRPCNVFNEQTGMSLRDWFAGQAMSGFCADPGCEPLKLVAFAYEIADRMIAARDKKGN